MLLHVVDTHQKRITPQYIFMQILRILYVALPCTDAEWDGTATERTRIYLAATLGMNILLRTRYVATDLVTSQKSQPIRCASMLCQFGRTRNVYVATRFILLSSAAESSATSGYVAVPEPFFQNEEPACINEERIRKKPSFVPKVE